MWDFKIWPLTVLTGDRLCGFFYKKMYGRFAGQKKKSSSNGKVTVLPRWPSGEVTPYVDGPLLVLAPGGYSREFYMGVCRLVLQILTLFQTNKCLYSHPFSDLASEK